MGRRRRLLAALVAIAVVAVAGILVARERRSPERVTGGSAAAHGATIERYTLRSRAVGETLRQVAVTPPGARPGRPLLVFLHGRGGRREEANVTGAFLAALAAQGDGAPAVVFPAGGDHSYWHDRRDGRWGTYVLEEVIPAAVRRLGADPRRVAIGGISMGGFGALHLARLAPGRFCAVGGHSAAVWTGAGETAPGAFDDAEDFARHDLVGVARARGRAAWGGARLWLDAGAGDPFRPGGTALAAALGIELRTWAGGHDGAYWRAHFDEYLRFYAGALARCAAQRA